MKNTQIKCSMKNHEKSDVNHYCQECKIYMCNKCENLHSELFQNHHLFKLGKDNKELFTGYCSIESHVLYLIKFIIHKKIQKFSN